MGNLDKESHLIRLASEKSDRKEVDVIMWVIQEAAKGNVVYI